MKPSNLLHIINPTLITLYVVVGVIGYHLIPDLLKNIYPVSNWWGAIIGIVILSLGMRGFFSRIIDFIFDIPEKFISLFGKTNN